MRWVGSRVRGWGTSLRSSQLPMAEVTSPLRNGDAVPTHPSTTTARRITKHLRVIDATDGTKLRGGLHRSELQGLMAGNQQGLSHLYHYAIIGDRIYHTRPSVTIEVECTDVVE